MVISSMLSGPTNNGSRRGGFPASQVTLLLLGLAWCGFALIEALQRYVPLDWYLGRCFAPLLVGLAASVLLMAGALLTVLFRFRRSLPRLKTGRFVRGLIYALMAGAIVFIACCQPYRALLLDFAGSLALGLFALGVLALPRLERLTRSRWMRRIDIVLMNLCVVLILSESALRGLALLRPSAILSLESDTPEQVLKAHRYPPGFVRLGFACNSGGYYDTPFEPKPAGEKLVVVIGDSFSAGVVPHHFHYTTVAERRLGCRVYNLGVPSIGPSEYLHLLEQEVLPLEPDLVVIGLFIGNDVTDCRARRETSALEDWLSPDSLLLVQFPRRMLILREETRNNAGHVLGEMNTRQVVTQSEAEVRERFPWALDHSLEGPTMSRSRFLATESERARAICGSDTSGYSRLFEVLQQIVRVSRGTKLVLMLIPDEFQVEDSTWQGVRRVVSNAGELRRDQPQAILRQWLLEQGVEYLDLLPELRALEVFPDGKRHCYHLRDTHFNGLGNAVAGEALARRLLPLLGS